MEHIKREVGLYLILHSIMLYHKKLRKSIIYLNFREITKCLCDLHYFNKS